MAKLILEFPPDILNKTLADFEIDIFARIADSSPLNHNGLSLTELGFGFYIAEATIVSDTMLRLSLKSDPDLSTIGIFSLSDDHPVNVVEITAKLNAIRDMLIEQKNAMVIHPTTLNDGLSHLNNPMSGIKTSKVYIPVSSNPQNGPVTSNNGKNVKYKDGSELVIGS